MIITSGIALFLLPPVLVAIFMVSIQPAFDLMVWLANSIWSAIGG